ncbi:MAG: sodium/proton-translocating pyrophosphatase, partial [Candidatus Methanomethylophilus sp.]|nr:sodium/proton-translocating pyrophosphatase [Methanomethylophilus sp.]
MVEFTGDNLLFIVPIAAVVALVVAFLFFRQVFSKDKGTPEMQAISDKIEEGAMAYLARQYKTIGIIAVVIAIIIAIVGFAVKDFEDYLNYKVAIAFILGAGCSILSGFIGMKVSVNSNIRTSAAARRSLGEAFQTSFRGGAVSGLAVSVLSLAGLFLVFFIYSAWCDTMTLTLHSVVGFAFGASMAALFAQLGGGIYTKAADVGADLVGKVEAGIPEDDPRNPAVIADLVGDNVGDCAGRGADIFESTAAEIIGSMVIGLAVVNLAAGFTFNFIYLPLVIMAFGLIASIIGIFTVRLKDENSDVIKALNTGYYVTMGLVIVSMIFACYWLLKDEAVTAFFGGEEIKWYMFAIAGCVGIALGLVVVYVTQYYTGDHKPVQTIAEQSESGPATNVIMGLSVGLESTVIPVVCIGIAIVATYLLGFYSIEGGNATLGLYGTAIATVSMLASSAFILAEDT